MTEEGTEVRILEEHWPCASDGMPLACSDTEPLPMWTDQELELLNRERAADKAWELTQFEAYCRKLEAMFP